MGDVSAFAFTAEQVKTLTRLSLRQLNYWADTGFFVPNGGLYTFRDVVGLRAIAKMRNELSVPLQELRKVGAHLRLHHADPWSSLRFWVSGRHVYFEDPSTGARVLARPPEQAALPVEMKEIADDLSVRVQSLRKRPQDTHGKIARRNRQIARNLPTVAGTRIPTIAIWNFKSAGYTEQQILDEYPSLTRDDIRAALAFEVVEQTKKRAKRAV